MPMHGLGAAGYVVVRGCCWRFAGPRVGLASCCWLVGTGLGAAGYFDARKAGAAAGYSLRRAW